MHSMFQTTNLKGPEESGDKEWKLAHDQKDATLREIQEYCKFLPLFDGYISFLMPLLSPASAEKRALDNINYMVDGLPTKNQLLKSRAFTVPSEGVRSYYHISYLRSRSTIIKALAEVVFRMTHYKQMFTNALPTASNLDEHEKLYNAMLASYEKWRAMAESQITVPLLALRRREQSGRRLRQLLARLDALALQDVRSTLQSTFPR